MFAKRHATVYFAGLMFVVICAKTWYGDGQARLKEADTADILSLVKVCELFFCALGIPCALLLIASAATEAPKPRLALPAAVNLIALIAVNLGLAAVEVFFRSDLEAAKNCGLMAAYLACILYSIVRFYRNETKGVAGATEEIAMDAV